MLYWRYMENTFQSYDMQVTSNAPAASTFKPLQSILKQIVPMSGYTPVICNAQHWKEMKSCPI